MSLYDDSIPQPTDKPAASQGQILNNFFELNKQFGVEHDSLLVGTGRHKYVTLELDPGGPAPTGTDHKLQYASAAGKRSLEVLSSAGNFRHIPLRTIRQVNVLTGGPYPATRHLVDMNVGFGDNSSGIVIVYQRTGSEMRSILSPFYWQKPSLYLPNKLGQLNSTTSPPTTSGGHFRELVADGTWLSVIIGNSWTADSLVDVLITESRTLLLP